MYIFKFTIPVMFLSGLLSGPGYVDEKTETSKEPSKVIIRVPLVEPEVTPPEKAETPKEPSKVTLPVPVGSCDEIKFDNPDASTLVQDRWQTMTEDIVNKGFKVDQLKKAIDAVNRETPKKGSPQEKGKSWFLRRVEQAFSLLFTKSLEELREELETFDKQSQEKIAALEKTNPFDAMALKRILADRGRNLKNAVSLVSSDENAKNERKAALSELTKALEGKQLIETKCRVWQALM